MSGEDCAEKMRQAAMEINDVVATSGDDWSMWIHRSGDVGRAFADWLDAQADLSEKGYTADPRCVAATRAADLILGGAS